MPDKTKQKINIKDYVAKMSDDDLKKFVQTSITEEIAPEHDEMLNAAIDECKKRNIDVLKK